MADIRLRVKDAFIDDLRSSLGTETNVDVIQDALTLMKWAVEERKRGKFIVSTDHEGQNVVRLALRSLDSIQSLETPFNRVTATR